MANYWLWIKQKGQGCDYMIGCGQVLVPLKGETREITVPGTSRKVKYDSLQRLGVGMSRLGTSEAVAIGACAFALRKLDEKKITAPLS